MGNVVEDTDLRLAADVVDAAEHSAATSGRLPSEVLSSLARLVPCDLVTFADLDIAARAHHVLDAWDGRLTPSTARPTERDLLFWTHFASSPPCTYPIVTGDQRTVTQTSDFLTQAEWHRSPMYAGLFRSAHINWEMMCCLPSVGARSRRVLFFRSGPVDFSDRDRMLLALLRPHLANAYARSVPAGRDELTVRQRQLLALVAEGKTNAEIAAELVLSPYTVRKHMENIFARLGVTTRAAAVARLGPLA